MKKGLLTILALTGSMIYGYSQEDSTRHHLKAVLNGSLNKVADGSIYMLNNTLNYSYRHEKIVFNARTGFVYGESLDKLTNRDYQAGADFNIYWNAKKKWYSWGLTNALSSYSLNIDHQFQGGVGVALNVLDEKAYYLNISDGIIYEQSAIINKEGNPENYSTFRNSLRLNFGISLKDDKLVFRSNNFWQPSFTIKNDYIITSKTDLNIKIYKWIEFNTSLTYNKISRTEKENFLWTYGIVFSRKF